MKVIKSHIKVLRREKPMLSTIVLITAGLSLIVIGYTYLFKFDRVLASLGSKMANLPLRHVLRANYGGTFPAFGILFILGAFIPSLTFSALLVLFVFMAGFAIGRLVSIKLDGRPPLFMLFLTAIEIVYSGLAIYLILKL